MKVLVVFILVMLFAFFDQSMGDDYCKKEFFTRKYIPMFADGLKRTDLEVRFDNHTVKCGGNVTFLGAFFPPTLKLDVTDKCVNVTILAFLADPLANPPFPILLVVNVPSSALKKGFVNGGLITDKIQHHHDGNVIATYIDPEDPTAGLGLRNLTVVYFIYCQCVYNSDLRLFTRIDRLDFKVKPYTEKHGLKCPVAGLFHQMLFTGISISGLPVTMSSISLPKSIPDPMLPLPAQ